MLFRRRQHRLLALLALLGMLFQQVALATYVCPHESGSADDMAMSQMPGCHESVAADKARCFEHCHPQVTSTDHPPTPTVPAAMLPPTTWLRTASRSAHAVVFDSRCGVMARATAPPLTIRLCTFQI